MPATIISWAEYKGVRDAHNAMFVDNTPSKSHGKQLSGTSKCRTLKDGSPPHIPQSTALPQLSLLSLPAELRRIIWNFALLEDELIAITRQLRPPGLIATCRQIRRETHSKWYQGNAWTVDIMDYDGRFLIKWMWCWRMASYSSLAFRPKKLEMTVRVSGRPNWTKLEEWLYGRWTSKDVAEGCGPRKRDGMSPEEAFCCSVHELLDLFLYRPWEEFEAVLHAMRDVALRGGQEWEM